MNIVTEHITIKNEVLTLTNQRAIYWDSQKALILSDVHIGKTAHFRRHGIPMPDDILQKDLERLQQLVTHFKAEQLLIVGDLFHAEFNIDMSTFKNWHSQFEDLQLVLIRGNHDSLSKRLMDDFNIRVETALVSEPFIFIHEHSAKYPETFTISGHTHPGVLIKGKGKQKLKLPCYQVASNQLILPAFSLFTGLNTKSKPDGAVCYAFTDSSIFKFE
ncbi:ligase-associated DNA damage response endonuclease PdeM [Winogradskyella flava]|uniref:Ligase-associated DNA damage response endonuclease PdeM n=1 Tax=Winogradskyella flava TaxID=1884876 RepID=A0A842ISZ9_9FLAO|nr:ligase-associated DNA damage response endonuclease PdeM [Winogradskyella flava]MBC2845279.1 ligase-associated DNA damage response endonuclease PdeM [Winogradskyella flava]